MGFRDTVAEWLGLAPAQRALEWSDVWGSDTKIDMFDVSGEKALRLIPVYSAVSLIADMLAMLPIHLYKKQGNSRMPADLPAWLERPDPTISRFDWVHQMASSLLLRGNAYGYVAKGSNGQVLAVRWINPSKVTIDESGTWPIYYVNGKSPQTAVEQGGTILHLRAFTVPGSVEGLSPVGLFKAQFETARSAIEYGRDWFNNSSVPSGILKNDKATLDPVKTKEAKAAFMRSVNKGEPVALDQNWSWEQVSLSPGEAQFLETIQASATQIASIFRVAPEDVGGKSGDSLTYATVELDQLKFNVRTLQPWTTRAEMGILSLLGVGEQLKFELDALIRPDLKARTEVTALALRTGQIFHDEMRATEDRPPATPEQIAFWRENYQKQPDAAVTPPTTREG